MKRPPPNFVVEVRRQRRSSNAAAKSWLTDMAEATPARHVGAAALFDSARKPEPALASAPPRPQGRILPSLVNVEPAAPPDEPPATAPRRARRGESAARESERDVRKPAKRERAPTRRTFEEPAPVVDSAPEEIAAPSIAASPRFPRAEAAVVAARRVAEADSASEAASADQAEARRARHRRILERYVLGSEPKPGQRWKKRSRKTQS